MSCGIKKCVLALSLVLAASFLFAQEQDGSGQASNAGANVVESDLYYYNLPIVKISDHPRGYYILYRTPSLAVRALCVPSEWFSAADQRAYFIAAKGDIQPYISFVTSGGEFDQIRIVAPPDPKSLIWGRVSSNMVPDEHFDAEALSLQF